MSTILFTVFATVIFNGSWNIYQIFSISNNNHIFITRHVRAFKIIIRGLEVACGPPVEYLCYTA